MLRFFLALTYPLLVSCAGSVGIAVSSSSVGDYTSLGVGVEVSQGVAGSEGEWSASLREGVSVSIPISGDYDSHPSSMVGLDFKFSITDKLQLSAACIRQWHLDQPGELDGFSIIGGVGYTLWHHDTETSSGSPKVFELQLRAQYGLGPRPIGKRGTPHHYASVVLELVERVSPSGIW